MDLTADLTIFFADFGVAATYTPAGGAAASITVLFDNAFVAAEGVESLGPAATCKASDVANARHGDTLVIDSTTYNIIGIHPDGAGLTLLLLSKD